MATTAIGQHYMVTNLKISNQWSDGFNDAGPLVTQYSGQRYWIILVANNHVGVTHSGGDDFDQYLVSFRKP
ncbi:hypothetical protein D3C81_1710740 [compost metagenome]